MLRTRREFKSAVVPGIIAGTVLFGEYLCAGGLVYTTAGKAAFVTGLYVVLVPLISILGRKIGEQLAGSALHRRALPAVHQGDLTVNYGICCS